MSSTAITEQEILALEGEALDKAVERARFGPHEFFLVTADGDDLCRVNVGGYSAWKSELMLHEWLARNQSEGYLTDICIAKRPRDVNRPFVVREHVPRYSYDEAGLFLTLLKELKVEFDGHNNSYPKANRHWHIVSISWLWSVQIQEHNAARSYPIVGATNDVSLAVAICRAYLLYRLVSE